MTNNNKNNVYKSCDKIFNRLDEHLNSGGILMFTSGPSEGEVWSDNGGEMLYHASLSPEEYKKLLTEHHFELIKNALDNEGGAYIWVARCQQK